MCSLLLDNVSNSSRLFSLKKTDSIRLSGYLCFQTCQWLTCSAGSTVWGHEWHRPNERRDEPRHGRVFRHVFHVEIWVVKSTFLRIQKRYSEVALHLNHLIIVCKWAFVYIQTSSLKHTVCIQPRKHVECFSTSKGFFFLFVCLLHVQSIVFISVQSSSPFNNATLPLPQHAPRGMFKLHVVYWKLHLMYE